MIKVKGKPITGTNTAMKPRPPVQMKEGAMAQKQIKMPPMPFANKLGPANLPTSHLPDVKGAEVQVSPGRLPHGISSKPIGQGLPKMRDAGYERGPDHSGNIFGRFGTNHPKRSRGQNLGASRKQASFYGE